MKSGNFNFLEPSGPLQACNGTALPLPYILVLMLLFYYLFFLKNFLLWHIMINLSGMTKFCKTTTFVIDMQLTFSM